MASFFKEIWVARCSMLMGDIMIEEIVYRQGKHTIQAVDKVCHRCLGHNLSVSENEHVYCEECSTNRVMADFLFLNRIERQRQFKKHRLKLPFTLSPPQVLGQAFIEKCYKDGDQGFLHAVCGAGKTEMSLSTILKALNEGKSIAFIIPRVEIIKQLIKRFRGYFPKTNICGLFQNQGFDESADIYISTPQQLIRFYDEFDLMFIDEADAFPIYQNDYLNRLVEKARKKEGVMIYISATRPAQYVDKIEKGLFKYCLIPERYHQKDLIVPVFKMYRYLYSNQLLLDIRMYDKSKEKLLIFFPSIHLMSRYHYFLTSKGFNTLMISSHTTYKKDILKSFVGGGSNILLTTTLLERGVTFKRCDVFVFESDHPIFNKDTLVQIAGRVGRDAVYHKGKIVLYSRFISPAMTGALEDITYWNQMADHDM